MIHISWWTSRDSGYNCRSTVLLIPYISFFKCSLLVYISGLFLSSLILFYFLLFIFYVFVSVRNQMKIPMRNGLRLLRNCKRCNFFLVGFKGVELEVQAILRDKSDWYQYYTIKLIWKQTEILNTIKCDNKIINLFISLQLIFYIV